MKGFRKALWLLFFMSFLTPGTHAAVIDVAIGDFFFDKNDITINVGDTVRWTKGGTFPHTTTSGTGCSPSTGANSWNSGSMANGQTFERVFTAAGTFPYFCSFHCLQMQGVVRVNPVPILPLPAGQEFFEITPAVATPQISDDPALAKPIGIGQLASGGAAMRLDLGLARYQGPVNLIFGAIVDAEPAKIYLLSSDNTLEPFVADVLLWKQNVTAAVSEAPLGGLPVAFLRPGNYDFYLLVTPTTPPAGQFPYHLWHTRATIP